MKEGEGWAVFTEDTGGCFFCGEPVDDGRFRVWLAVVREWQPGAQSTYVAHVECMRRAKHHTQTF
jgi:hypothetical protein